MDRKTILEALENMREIEFLCWEEYRDKGFRALKKQTDRNIRVLDYLMTEVRKHDAV